MIKMMRDIVAECDTRSDAIVRVIPKVDYAGVMVTVDRRDGSDCGAFLISWEQLTAGDVNAARAGIRATVGRVRGF